MKTKKRLRKLEELVETSRENLDQAIVQARKATERAERARLAADEAREDFKRVERLLRKELTRMAARKRVEKKKAAKKAREKSAKKGRG